MKILFMPECLEALTVYIDNRKPVIKDRFHALLIEQQAHLFNFLFKEHSGKASPILPTSDPIKLFNALCYLPGYDTGVDVLDTQSNDNALLYALNIVEKGDTLPLSALYGEDSLPGLLYEWCFKAKREPDTSSGVTGAKFLKVELVPATSTSSKTSFTLDDESTAKKMFCAEYFKTMRTMTRVSDGTNDSITALFSENPVLTALYACHLTQGI